MEAKQIIDYAYEDNAKDFRESLYAAIYDKVNAHIEQKKQEIAHGLVTQESCATKGDAKKIAKKEVKKHEDDMHEELSEYSLEEIEQYMQTEEFDQLDEVSKDTLKSYVKKAAVDAGTDQMKMVRKKKGPNMTTGTPESNPKAFRNIGKQREKGISKALDRLTKESVEELDESTRKHFQQVADLIKSHDSHDKRKELAQHHATIFAMQNPRFDRSKFMKAANVQE